MKIEIPASIQRVIYLLCAVSVFGIASAQAAPLPQVIVSGNASPLLGETATLNISMSNASVTPGETGFYPIFELRLPPGLQCNGACQSAIAYSLPPAAPVVVTSCGGFPSSAGNCTNPVTNEVIARAANQTILFFTLPVGTLAVGQPAVTLSVPATMTSVAAVGTPMTVNARGIFALGSTATGVRGPCGGPNDTICQSPQNSFIQTPALLNLAKTTTGNPGDATGPTYIRNFEISSNIATGATITSVTLSDPIPDSVVVLDPPAANCTGSPTFLITPAPTTCTYTHDPNGGASLTATFASVTGTASTQDIRVQFRGFVQRFNDNNPLSPLISPTTGDSTSSTNTATLNYSYLSNPQPPVNAAATINHRSLTSAKSVNVQDNSPTGISPGDRLTWTVVVNVSDYFSFDDLQIDDFIQDGQTYVPDSFSARVVEGAFDQTLNPTRTNQGVFGGHLIVSPKDGNGDTHIEFNLSDALLDPLVYNQDGVLTGADALGSGVSTRVEFSYQTIIDENYVTVPMGDTVVIDGGDIIANFANIDFRVFSTLNRETLNNVAADVTVQALQTVIKTAAFENGGALSSPLRIGPPDDLTYRIRLIIPTGDLEELHVRDFLPTPLFSAVDSDANGVPNAFTQIAQGDTAPAAGEWRYTTASTITPAVGPVVTDAGTNSLFWDFANLVENGAASQQEIIEILFTIRATAAPMADDLQLVNLLAVDHATSNGSAASTTAAAIATLRTEQPRLTIVKAPNAVISSNGSVSGDSFINVDAEDVLEFVVRLANTGSHEAYDVRVVDNLPAGLVAPGGGYSMSVTNGTGITSCNVASFTDTSVGNMFRASGGIMPAGSQCNIVYRVQVASAVAWNFSIINTAVADFASLPAGPTFQSVNDTATVGIRGPSIAKSYQLGSSSDPVTADPLLRANEAVTFRFTTTVPEGHGANVEVAELDIGTGNPDTDFFKNLTPADITFPAAIQNACSNGNPALFNFTGQTDVCFTLNPSLAANQQQVSATRYEVRFGTVSNFNTNNAVAETFSVDFRVRQQPNKVFGAYTNRAEVSYTGGSATGTASFNLGDPRITLAKTSPSIPPASIGSTIRFQVTAANVGTSPAYNVGDVVDTLPLGVGSATLVSATNAGIDVTGVMGFSFTQVGNQVHVTVFDISGNRQIEHGEEFVVVYDVTVTGTNVPDSIVGPGHPGGVVDGPGCVDAIVNSVDIFSFDTGSGDPDTLLNVDPASATFALDSDGDGILNSIERSAGCIDSDGDGVPDYLDTDSDDNGVPDSTEYAGGADMDGDGIPNYRDLDDDGDGISDWTEIQNAGGPLGDFDGDGIPDWRDIDSDNDGILDLTEGNLDFDGDGRRNYRDRDSDNDGIPDIVEAGGVDTNGDGVADSITDTDGDGWSNLFDPSNGGTPLPIPNTDGTGGPNYLDRDSDGDGITDLREAGGADADGNGVVDGAFFDPDADGYSGVYDSNDGGTPLIPPNTDGTGGADYVDTDSDDDTIPDNVEGQPSPPGFFAPLGTDTDGDGIDNRYDTDQGGLPIIPVNTDGSGLPDYRDTDSDNDTIPDSVELTGDPDGDLRPNYRDLDSDGDTLPDAIELLGNPDGDAFPNYLDLDSDGDGILDILEGLVDSDADFVPDFLDLDSDNDGVFDNIEGNIDSDGDGRPNRLDLDSDNDGIPDTVEAGGTDLNGDGRPDTTADTDGDGVLDLFDVSNGGTPLVDLDFDGSVPNRLDIDSDNDGIVDIIEAGGVDANGDGRVDGVFTDGDGDGFSSLYDSNDGGTPLPRPNTDGLTFADYLDIDSDNDGISDNIEGRPNSGLLPPTGVDTDGDGLDNRYDTDNGGTPIVPVNTDGQTVPDYRDLDSDNDLIPDSIELTGDPDGDGIPNYRDTDSDGDGIPDIIEGTGDADSDTIPNYLDTDSDNDGIPDSVEGSVDSDGDGVPDSRDLDSDNDGVLDSVEGNIDSDGDGRPDRLDRDSDNDGIPDIIESGGVDVDGDGRGDNLTDSDGDGLLNIFDPSNGGSPLANLDFDGDTRPNRIDIDSDNDGIVDLIEAGGTDADGNGRVDGPFVDIDNDGFSSVYDVNDGGTRLPLPNTDGLTGPDYLDTDSDEDSISDNVEGQPDAPGYFAPLNVDTDGDGLDDRYDPDQGGLPIVPVNTDGVGLPDYRDTDSDNDLIPDSVELTGDPDGDGIPNYRDLDSDGDMIPDILEGIGNPDGDGFPNYLDTDSDNDGIPDGVEGLLDSDGDGIVNALDPDSDNDGILDLVETDIDSDGDGRPDYLDLDSDNDGIPDVVESGGVDANGDGRPDSTLDSDGDGILNLFDPSNGGAPLGSPDFDSDGVPNRIDIDSDGDGIVDLIEAGGVDVDGNGRVDGTFVDIDNDGFSSVYDVNDGGTKLPLPNTDGLTGPDYLDTDSDEDSISDNVEGQPNAPGYFAPLSVDTDGDGLDDRYDPDQGGLPIVPVNTDGVGLPDYRDTDSDNDLIPDSVELTGDPDGDGIPNYRDLDSDGDMIPDILEGIGNPDGDGFPNYLDTDSDNDGISDTVEGSSDFDGDGVPNFLDPDSDNDGVRDVIEGAGDADGDGHPNYLDLDSDDDGIPDTIESGGFDIDGDGLPDTIVDLDADGILDIFDTTFGNTPLSDLDFDADLVPNRLDIDSDNDGIVDLIEAGGEDANGDGRVDGLFGDSDGDGYAGRYDTNDGGHPLPVPNSDSLAGRDYLDLDSDQDGISDNVEGQPHGLGFIPPSGLDDDLDGLDNAYDTDQGGLPIVPVNTDGVGFPDYRDIDADNDMIPDSVEGVVDTDGDSIPNYRDLDSDGDTLPDLIEGTGDIDGDTIPNYLDPDSDGDGIPDNNENLVDTDGDGIVNAQDPDSDNDGVLDSVEGSVDSDGDGRPNYLDLDSDNDGIPDVIEAGGVDQNGDGLPDSVSDTDHDGLLDIFDSSNGGTLLPDPDSDGDTIPNRLDLDSDDDGIVDLIEAGGLDADGNGVVDGVFADADGDGYFGAYDLNDGGTRLPVPNTDLLLGPDYLDTDSDEDGISDNVEGQPHDIGYIPPAGTDLDGDGLDSAYDTDEGGLPIVPVNTDGVGAPDYRDTDSDNDLILDSVEGTSDFDSDTIPNYRDTDSDGDTIPDIVEGNVNTDGLDGPDYLDLDSDNDGIPDSVEGLNDRDSDGVPNFRDIDSDNDGILDAAEGNVDFDGDLVPNYFDLDSDNDGIPDIVEAGGVDANGDGFVDNSTDTDHDGLVDLFDSSNGGALLPDGDFDGDSLPNRTDIDADGDGIVDLVEAGGIDSNGDGLVDAPFDDGDGDGFAGRYDTDDGGIALPKPNTDGTGGPDYLDIDSDGDTISDNVEGQPHGSGFRPPLGLDTDGDGLDDEYDIHNGGSRIVLVNTDAVGAFDYRDTDSDNDGILDSIELTGDFDGDGIPNYRDLDSDGDNIPDSVEQNIDSDGDGSPNYLDTDSDNDGIPDDFEETGDFDGDGVPDYIDIDSDNDGILDLEEGSGDADGDGVRNYHDRDSDNDGIADIIEAGGVDSNGDGVADTITDTDGDGWADLFDPNNGGTPLPDADFDADLLRDRVDIDSDNDGLTDLFEAGGIDANGDGRVDGTFTDTDADGFSDVFDTSNGGTNLPLYNTDGTGGPDYIDADSDDDTILDNVEAQPHDVNYRAPLGVDTDGDGLDDEYDPDHGTPIALVNTDMTGLPDYRDTDSDDDGILDSVEGTVDSDGDTIPNYRDLDSDGDTILDSVELLVDFDSDTIPNYLDLDSDADTIPDSVELAGDSDGDGHPDYNDLDSDNDGLLDSTELAVFTDNDANEDFRDADSDNDGIPDIVEAGGVDADGDGTTDNFVDTNNDGWSDEYDSGLGGTALADADTDSDGVRNRLDLDSDDDGLPDILEALGIDADGDGVLDGTFTDTDGDGFSDIVDTDDGGVSLALPNTDNTGGPDYLDTDSDDDSIPDNIEGQPHGVDFVAPSGVDSDGDGYDDAYDPTAGGDPIITPVNTDMTGLPDYRDTDADDDTIDDMVEGTDDEDGDGTPNYRDLDSDGDNIPDSVEGTTDTDSDGTPDYLDTDSDNDGIDDKLELNGDPDGDGIPNRLDLDSDNDGIPDLTETSTDMDIDGIPNYLDIDSDNDGVVDIIEAGGIDGNFDGRVDIGTDSDSDGLADIVDPDDGGTPLLVPDTDSDTYSDYLDIDSDNDGILDNVEAQSTSGYIAPLSTDTDGDGLNDAYDLDSLGTPLVPVNTDSDGLVDMLDLDSDNDGVLDLIEGQDADANGISDVVPSGTDTDADGLDDAFDTVVLAGIAETWTNPVGSNVPLQDRDSDLIRDWRDTDDDGDTIPTVDEDENNNLNWADDDGDGDNTPDYLDLDSDNDGIDNVTECLGQIPCADTDGDGVTNHLDVDSDNDGLLDSLETTADADRDNIPNYLDIDSDNDGIVDVIEAGGVDSNGDGRLDGTTDADTDGLLAVVDPDEGGTPLLNPNSDSDVFPNYLDIDSDNDGITDNTEAQTTSGYIAPSGGDSDGDGLDNAYDGTTGGTALLPINTDGTGLPDYLDLDSEDDGIQDQIEGNDVNHDGVANIVPLGVDSDNDGLDNAFDTFDLLSPPSSGFNATGSNSPLPDLDNDMIRDWRDTDDDGDGIPTLEEGTVDTDGDGIPNAYDTDSDGDGAPDADEYGNDTDNDGIDDYLDPNCTLGFQVQLPSGEPLSGVTVTNGGLYTAVTNSNGLATIPSVVNGVYNFRAVQQGGTILGQPQVTVTNGSCGSVLVVNAQQILTNPVYFVWNGFYRQQNIAGAMNKCDHTIGVEVTLFDLFGVEHSTQSVPLLAHAEYDVVANALEGYGADIYGYIRVNYLEPECAEGYAAHYRFDPTGQNEEFSISKSFESVQVGPVYAEFNTMQPDPNPAKLDDESPHWVQIVNLHPTAFKAYDVILRDTGGSVVDAAEVVVGPKNRYDTQGGHVIPGKLKSGSIELVPHDPNSPYLAQVHNYNADDAFAVFANTFSFASGVTMRGGANYTQYVNISSGGGGFDWLVLTNLEDSTTAVELEFWANDGTLLSSETRMMTPRRQDHIYVSGILRGTESGIAKIRSLDGKRITAKNQLYFAGPLGNITAAYGIAARPIYAGTLTGPYNTFLNTFNYLKVFNVTNDPQTATVVVYRVDGSVIGTVDIDLAPHTGGDFELRVNLGMNVPPDSYGGLEVIPSTSGAIYSELLRIKPGGALAPIDMAQSLPVR